MSNQMDIDILDLPGVKTISRKIVEAEGKIVLEAVVTDELEECPLCHVAGKFQRHSERWVTFRDIPIRQFRVVIRFQAQYCKCKACGKFFLHRPRGMAANREMTARCLEWIRTQSMAVTFAHLAEIIGCDEGTVRSIAKQHIASSNQKHRINLPKWLGIDETHLGNKEYCVFSDVSQHRAVDLIERTTRKAVAKWLFSTYSRSDLQGVTMDMCRRYRNAVKDVFPNVPVVVDKFHVVKKATEAMDAVRRDLAKNRPKEQSKAWKRLNYLLRKRAHSLSPMKRAERDAWLLNEPPIKDAYWLKEDFFKIYDHKSRSDAFEALKYWRNTMPKAMRKFFLPLLRALINWEPEIMAYFDHGRRTNAYTKALNRITKKVSLEGWNFDHGPKTNAYAEALNRNAKKVNLEGRGYKFETIRGKVLFSDTVRLGNARRRYDANIADPALYSKSHLFGIRTGRDMPPVKIALLHKYGCHCQNCGGLFNPRVLELSHSRPLFLGKMEDAQVMILCPQCHVRLRTSWETAAPLISISQ
ncbi:MAG: ISL3 family transposase [Terracidiphilus sp.]